MTIQTARSVYEANAVASIAAHFLPAAPAISDQDQDNEREAQEVFYAALAAFRTACITAANLSELRRDAITDTLAFAEDARPDRGAWDEAIRAKVRGWV